MSGSLQRGVAAAAALVLLVALGWTILRPVGQYRSPRTSPGRRPVLRAPSVRILGIPVGTITDVVPQGDKVQVRHADSTTTYKVPAQADAVILAPSLVSDRYVQSRRSTTAGRR